MYRVDELDKLEGDRKVVESEERRRGTGTMTIIEREPVDRHPVRQGQRRGIEIVMLYCFKIN